MTIATGMPFLIVCVPLVGAAIGLTLRAHPDALKGWLLVVVGMSLGTVGWGAAAVPRLATGFPLVMLPPLAAFVSLLGQPLQRQHASAWLLTPVFLSLGLGVFCFAGPASEVSVLLLLTLLALVLVHYREHAGGVPWWAIAAIGVGVLGVAGALLLPSTASAGALLLACAVMLPLLPFHTAYVAAVTGLPANLPAFLVLVLPMIGFAALQRVLPHVPASVRHAAVMAALAGMVYGSIKSLTPSRMSSVVANSSMALFSILWWYLLTAPGRSASTVVYATSVGLAFSGLLLAWSALRARYGEVGFRALSGLAEAMPRFAVVLSLLGVAAIGLPPFGLFAGFVGMLLAPEHAWSAGLPVALFAWLCASWYLFDLVQGLLFGPPRAVRRHEDLRNPELMPLVIVLVVLLALGVLPASLFDLGSGTLGDTAAWSPLTWIR